MTNGKLFGLIAGAGCFGLTCAGAIGIVAVAVLFPGKKERTPIGGPVAIKGIDQIMEEAKSADPIAYAKVTRVKAAVPARYSAPLPLAHEVKEWSESDRFPPKSYVQDSLCAGDEDVERRFLEAARASAKRGAKASEIVEAYADSMRWCSNPAGLCELAAKTVVSKEPASVRELMWMGLVRCKGEKHAALFARKDVPPLAFVRRAQERRWSAEGALPWSPELEKAVRAAALTGPKWERRVAAMVLDMDDPRAAKALLSMHAAVKDKNEKHDIAMAMHRQRDKKAKAIFATACRAKSTDPMCDSKRASAPKPKPTGSLEMLVKNPDVELAPLVKENAAKKVELTEALATCATSVSGPDAQWRRFSCLEALAKIDRPRAGALAKTMTGEREYFQETLDSLARFPEEGQLERKLREHGLLPAGEGGNAITVRDALLEARRAHTFDVETGMWPNEHDSLLRELAALAPEDFAGVLFEEIAPDEDDMDEGSYELRAYVDGTRLATSAENLGDWYDVDAVLGLLNAVAKERGKPARYVVLAAYDQTATVVAGPEVGLRKAIAEELIDIGAANDAMDTGKAFEDEVMRKIQSGEIDLGK